MLGSDFVYREIALEVLKSLDELLITVISQDLVYISNFLLQRHVLTQEEYSAIHGVENAPFGSECKAKKLLQTIQMKLRTSKNGGSFTSLVKALENRRSSRNMAEQMVQLYSKF